MAISDTLTAIKQNLQAAYNKLQDKGATIPTNKNMENLAGTIETVSTGTDTSDATAQASDILAGKTAYVAGGKVTGTIETYDGSYEEIVLLPHRGDIITIKGKQYRVLWLEGTIAEVVSMEDATRIYFDGSSPYTNAYANNTIDTYCNNTFYSDLPEEMQNAIVDKTFTQDSWARPVKAPSAPYYIGTDSGNSVYYLKLVNDTYGTTITRHCYCLSVQDILDYLESTTNMSKDNTRLTSVNLLRMMWDKDVLTNREMWLRSARGDSTSTDVTRLSGKYGFIAGSASSQSMYVRPAFQIDFSKIGWTKYQ